jgi:pSer/pThr/pTyr-binding forkhead associated (FHA) protein
MMLALKLRIRDKPEGLRIPIDRLPFLVGRDPLCHLRPASLMVSQHHCAIWSRNSELWVRDLGSTNGTYLNGHALTGEGTAQNGDQLKIGPLVFDVCIEGTPTVSQPTPPPFNKNLIRGVDPEHDAAILLLFGDDASSPIEKPEQLDSVPTGKTVHLSSPHLKPSTRKSGQHTRTREAVSASGDTAEIANAILLKYLKRPRS